MFCCLEPVSCRLAVATNCRLELQPVVTNIPKCGSEQYSVHLLRISFSSVRHFPDFSWIVEDLPCFSEVRSFTSWYALLLLFLFRQVSISSHWAPIQSSFAFFTAFWTLLFASLYSFAPSDSYPFFFKSLLSSQRSRTSLVTHGFFLRRSLPSISLGPIYVTNGN